MRGVSAGMNTGQSVNMKRICKMIQTRLAYQNGQILLLTLLLVLVSSLMLTPLLSYMGTGLKTGQVFEQKTERLYAADSGIDDGKWQIKYGHLETTCPTYSPYDFGSSWSYNLPEEVNNQTVAVSVQNAWVPAGSPADPTSPLNTPPDPAQAARIITGQSGHPPKIIITSNITGQYTDCAHPGTIEVNVQYYPEAGDNLTISDLGIWLPPGFTYRNDLGSNLDSFDSNRAPDVFNQAGGTAVLWQFNNWPYTGDSGAGKAHFPEVNPSGASPLVSKITFRFDAPEAGANPQTVAWINTNLDLTGDLPGNITYTWDGDVRVYHLTSTAGETSVEAYLAKTELRVMGGSVSGDYYAVGNSNLSDNDGDKCREHWNDPSTAAVTSANIPADARVTAAYLYWSGWKNENRTNTLFSDSCSSLGNWQYSSNWNVAGSSYDKYIRSHYSSGADDKRYLTRKGSLDLSTCTDGTVVISWEQWVSGIPGSGDGLDISFSADDGQNWGPNIPVFRGNIGSERVPYQCTIPTQYMTSGFRVRVHLVGFAGYGLNCNLDNIEINELPADSSVVFKIGNTDGSGFKQVYYDAAGQPRQGSQKLLATRSQSVRNYAQNTDDTYSPHGYSYSGFCDVTALVNQYSTKAPAPAVNHPGWATYSVGDIGADIKGDSGQEDQWSYANWSLIVIYSSSQTQGHQLYLFDKLVYSNQNEADGVNVDFDSDGQPGGTISGFLVPEPVAGEINAAKMTCFVGEGDSWFSDDYVAMNGTKLWDGTTTSGNSQSGPNNIFNSKSMGIHTNDGIDVDTLGIDPPNGRYITWSSGILSPGDTSAQVDMVTHQDVWNLVYMVLSFRSETTTGNTLVYLIKQ